MTDDEFWAKYTPALRKKMGFGPLTQEEAERAYAEAEPVPLSKERIEAMTKMIVSLDNWPTDPANGRYLCSPEHPMPPNAPGRWVHTNVEEVGEQQSGWPGGDIVRMRCRDCGLTWKQELPQ
jgi:hypothetical protein